jgi:type VI secretion system protein ImpA
MGRSMMAIFDVEVYLAPLAGDCPCGLDLEYDPSFIEMELASQSRPADEQLNADGHIITVSESKSADWRSVKKLALELLNRTKDIRVLVKLIASVIHLDGLVAVAEGMEILRGYHERYWDTVHPQLDPDDDNDPTMRLNLLVGLCEDESIRRGLGECPLAESSALGRVSQRDILMAMGQQSPPAGMEAPSMTAIEVIFMDCEIADLQDARDAIVRILAALAAINAFIKERIRWDMTPDLGQFEHHVRELGKILDEQLARRELASGVNIGDGSFIGGEGTGDSRGAAAPVRTPAGEVCTREDVISALDKCCEYFARNEPSSPVPILLRRARRFVSMNFVEIHQDPVPDGPQKAEMYRGNRTDD